MKRHRHYRLAFSKRNIVGTHGQRKGRGLAGEKISGGGPRPRPPSHPGLVEARSTTMGEGLSEFAPVGRGLSLPHVILDLVLNTNDHIKLQKYCVLDPLQLNLSTSTYRPTKG